MISSFLVNGILFSIINCYGVIFVSLKEFYKNQGNEEAATRYSTDVNKARKILELETTLSIILEHRLWVPLRSASRFCFRLCRA